jgi:hypothetical protein
MNRAIRSAVADQVSAYFGEDASYDEEDFFEDASYDEEDFFDDSLDSVLDFEIETALNDLFVESELEDLLLDDAVSSVLDDDEEEDDDFAAFGAVDLNRMGRVQASYGARMGFLKGLGKLIGTAGKGFMEAGGSEIVSSAIPGAETFFDQNIASTAGKALGQAAASAVEDMFPPLYVADDVTPSDSIVELDEVDLDMETEFGATCVGGMVARCSANPKVRKAAVNSIWRGAKAIKNAPYGRASTFVEDPSCQAVMSGDGRIYDSVYGELCVCPCPGCARVPPNASFGATARDCAVCDGYGAIMIPKNEVPDYASSESYGWVQFLVPLVAAGASAGASAVKKGKTSRSADLQRRKEEILQKLLSKASSEDDDIFDEDVDMEDTLDESMGYDGSSCVPLRALTPRGYK